jgi:hypothetical protein
MRWDMSRHLLAALAIAGLAVQSPEELLRRSDVGALAPASFRARLVLQRVPQGGRHEIEVWRSGDDKTLIRFLDPKERDKYLLRLRGELWLLAPGAKKPVRLNSSYRLYGGATLDEVLAVRLAREYTVESASEEIDSQGKLVALELRARSSDALFPQVHYVVRQATERPASAIYRLRSGKDATVVEFVQWNETGLVYARHVVVKDLLRKGEQTDVQVIELQPRSIPDELFSLDDGAARRALDATTSKSP